MLCQKTQKLKKKKTLINLDTLQSHNHGSGKYHENSPPPMEVEVENSSLGAADALELREFPFPKGTKAL